MIKPNLFKSFLLLGLASLLVAYVAQYLFGLMPCRLCYYQRIPYAAIITISMQALWLRKLPISWSYGLILLCILASISLSGFHLGVEHGWFYYHSSCIFDHEGVDSFEQYKLMLESADLVSCDTPTTLLFGISMVGWNFIYSLCMMGYFWYLYKKKPS